MNGLRHLGTAILWTTVFLSLACGETAPEPTAMTPGLLLVTLTTPNTDDGAIRFSVTGGPIDAVAPTASEHAFFFREMGATGITAALVGNLETGAVLEINIPDGSNASAYAATILEVADRQNALREDLANYELTVGAS